MHTENRFLLEIETLNVAYRERVILQNIDLQVCRGEVMALIGPNGAGKTTLIKTVSGVHPPQSGRIRAMGVDLIHLNPTQRATWLAVVPQARNLPETYSVWQTVLMGRTPYLGWLGRVSRKDEEQVRWALDQTDTTSLSERKIGELSGGEQQRVLLARALAQQTPILLLDEPTAHLDLRHQASLLNLIQNLCHEQGLGVLMALHDLNLVALYADRISLLVDGKLCATGKPAEVITAQQLSEAYQIPLQVIPHPQRGIPLVIPDWIKPDR